MTFINGSKSIVVATDLHGQADAALEYARKLAAAYGARIILAHGLDPLEYAAVDAVPGKVLTELNAKACNVLESLLPTFCKRAFTAILRFAKAL